MLSTHKTALLQEYLEKYPDPSKIGDLSEAETEQSNTKTRTLSYLAQENPTQAITNIIQVECDALNAFLAQTETHLILRNFFTKAIVARSRLFLVGCGASGRLVMLVERFGRDLQTERSGLQVIAVAAGGDIALINSISQFEDSPELAVEQLQKQGYQPGDFIIGFSANGAATFVLAALEYALHKKSPALLVTCNSVQHIIRRANTLKKTNLFKQGTPQNLHIVSFRLPPPALSGSTRMHPTTIMLLACLPLLAHFDKSYQDLICLTRALLTSLPTLPFNQLSIICRLEQEAYTQGKQILYRVNDTQKRHQGTTDFTLFTDLTERNPTFNLPPLGPLSELQTEPSLFWMVSEQTQNAKEFWMKILGRLPQPLNLHHLKETSNTYWQSCDFSIPSARVWQKAPEASTEICFTFDGQAFHIKANTVECKILMQDFPSFIQQILIKIILNACSTTIFAASRCQGNWMTNLTPSNLKLIQRMEHIMQRLAQEAGEQEDLNTIRKRLIQSIFAVW